jgi:CPA2 family monovalent cation:H+ antiporter-2
MPHQTPLITLLTAAFVLAFALGFVASRLRLPPLVGYLIAGIAIGPFTPGFVGDAKLATELAEIGVILLMFGVGLHFSVGSLLAVWRIAVPGAIAQILVATVLGALIAHSWGWSLGGGIVFGLALSVASTVVLLRALEQRGRVDSPEGRIAVGWLIVEDLAMVLALVLLPALAERLAPGAAAATPATLALTLGVTLGKVALFALLMLVGGRRVVPWLLARVAATGSRELFTLSVLAIAVGTAWAAAAVFHVSFALGAFFAGMVLAESELSQRAAEDSLPLQDAFAVLFFVSVGMLFDPGILLRDPLAVLVVVLVIVIGKSLAAAAIVLAFRHPPATALTVAASLAQIGEFSFILAGLGVTLGLLPEQGRDLVLAGALLSIMLNPLVFALLGRTAGGAPVAGVPAAPLPSPARGAEVIIVGYGRVGGTIARSLAVAADAMMVVELDETRVRAAREAGFSTVQGDAGVTGVFERLPLESARVLVLSLPDGFLARSLAARARERAPSLAIVVRTHDADLAAELSRLPGLYVFDSERELALAMAATVRDAVAASARG